MENYAVTSIVTTDYIPNALVLSSYLREANPEIQYIALIVAERDDIPDNLPNSTEWLCWDEIVNKVDRFNLASRYTPFELCCVLRGRLHHYLATQRDYTMWAMLDTDIGIFASLNPLWEHLKGNSILVTPHINNPPPVERSLKLERSALNAGMFNAGVVAMARTRMAATIAEWMIERLERFGHAHRQRVALGLPDSYDFEFVDQIWLNFVPIYFTEETVILKDPTFNLGHWNLHEGDLSIRNNTPYLTNSRVVVAHFSGLPRTESLESVSIYTDLYQDQPCSAWAFIASDYLNRLCDAKASIPLVEYSYKNIEPRPCLPTHGMTVEQVVTPISMKRAKQKVKHLLGQIARKTARSINWSQ